MLKFIGVKMRDEDNKNLLLIFFDFWAGLFCKD